MIAVLFKMSSKLLAILWKNYLMRRNGWAMTLYELLFPLGILLIVNIWLPPMPDLGQDPPITLDQTEQSGIDTFLYSPSNNFTEKLMDRLAMRLGYKRNNVVAGNLSDSGLFSYGLDLHDSREDMLKYTLYPGVGSWPDSLPPWKDSSSLIGNYFTKYSVITLAEVQYKINSAFTDLLSAGAKPKLWSPTVILQDMDTFSREMSAYGFLVVMAIFISYMFLVSPVLSRIVEEKNCGAKELMRMMGVKSWELWVGFLLNALTVIVVVCAMMIVLLYVPLTSTSTVVRSVNPFIFFFMIVLGMTSIVVGLFLLSCFFDSPVFASSVASILGVASAVLLGFLQMGSVAWWRRMLYCLLPHMALITSSNILMEFEKFGKDVNWLERLSTDGSDMNLAEVTSMMIADIILFSILTWYFDKVMPGKYGIPLTWNFFLKRNYWCPRKNQSCTIHLLKDGTEQDEKTPGISVKELRKVYRMRGKPSVMAVDGLEMEAKSGCITALLGHNGAGKTTTMQIITGLIAATSGSVHVAGYNIQTNPDEARSSLGLCPQQNLLFENLTALQTLIFFAMIKGLSYSNGKREAEELLKTLKMEQSKNKQNKELSGGQKRKVSLGVALIGGSKVVILDEPTAGVDAELRREICDLLLSFRGERTVLLTTHIMEEADAISDYIYIMDHGRVQCSGTPLDLKTQFGTGYTLQVVIKKDVVSKVKDAVKMNIPDSRFKAQNAATLSFQMPAIHTPLFPQLFSELDDMQAAGDIVSYSVSISTLEDVFVRVREMEKEKRSIDETDGSPYTLLASNTELNPGKLTGFRLLCAQMHALFVKAFYTFSRSYWLYLGFAGIPLGMMLLGEVITPLLQSYSASKPVTYVTSVNYSSPMYQGMDIFSQSEQCETCLDFLDSFTSIANGREFRAISTNNVSQALRDVFLRDLHYYSRYVAMGVEVSSNAILVRYNSQASNIISVAIDIIQNALLKNASISCVVDLKYTNSTGGYVSTHNTGPLQKQSSFLEVVGFQSLYYLVLMQAERQTGAKALQLMATPALVYWGSQFLLDLANFVPYITVASLAYYAFEPEDEVFANGSTYPFAIVMWGGGLILISYVITCYIKTRSNTITVAILVYLIFSDVLWIFMQTNLIPMWLGYFHPSTIWKIGMQQSSASPILLLAAYWAAMFAFLVLTESTIPSRVFHSLMTRMRNIKYGLEGRDVDGDVRKEEERVREMAASGGGMDTLTVWGLQRWYGLFAAKPAVRGVSFVVAPGECFGLLGVNGAGKSTTFNMLAAQIPCSGGDALLNSFHLSAWNTNKYLSQIAYCPQTSGIIGKLTGVEFLSLFARLRGYKNSQVIDIVHHWIRMLDLEECAGRLCGQYSGGMERKLIAAAAFLWDSSIVMLDEPTAGVDPVARRSIWGAVTSAQQAGKSVLLTSHSMEECEALCSRLAIMVDGSFRCLGETTTLKNKFGGGYSVQLKISPCTTEQFTEFEAAVKQALGEGSHLTDRHCSILHYHIDDKTSWKSLFAQLEHLKATHPVLESYVASETTLEQIFLDFAGRKRVQGSPEVVVEISE